MSRIVGSGMLDFREQNPSLFVRADLKKVYAEHKAEVASKILWSSYFYGVLTDSDNNPYYNMNEDVREDAIRQEFFEDFDPEKQKEIIDSLKDISLSKEEYLLNIQIKKLEQVTKSLENQEVATADEIKAYLSASKEIGKLWELYEKLSKKYVSSSTSKAQIHGDAEISEAEERRHRSRN